MASALIKHVALNPIITGPLLYLLTKAPPNIQQPVLQALRQYVTPETLERAVTALKWLVGLGLVRIVDRFFSELAQNNFRLRSEKNKYDWPKEIAVVTGAASGFGRLISEGFAAKGIRVMALDIHDSLPAEMQANKKIHYYKCDVTSADAVNDVADSIRSDHGNPSVLINNVGIASDANILQTQPETLKRMFDVNTLSHFYTVNAFMPSMVSQRKGHIVTIASLASFASAPYVQTRSPSVINFTCSPLHTLSNQFHQALQLVSGMVHYCMTKSAALAFHEGLAAELRSRKRGYFAPEIKLTCVHPTWAATPMIAPYRGDIDRSGQNVIDPQTVADAVVKQVLSGRGQQIILGGGLGWISGLRGWPHWLSGAIGAVQASQLDRMLE
ncbi:hypothetical protein Q7P37_005445 [Cladosporium fusiforme]